MYALRRWIRIAGTEEKPAGLHSYRPESGKNLARARRLEVRECAGDDLDVKGMVPFPRRIKLKRGETVVFSWIVFKSRVHRDRVNAQVMKDPRLSKMDPKSMPFNCRAPSSTPAD